MGHALNTNLQDILVRWKRMDGYNRLWLPGTDGAGIATQCIVERQLAREEANRHAYGRERFMERVGRWREESGPTITRQLMRLGASCDWSRKGCTMNEGLSRAARKVFVTLYPSRLSQPWGLHHSVVPPLYDSVFRPLSRIRAEKEGCIIWQLKNRLAHDGIETSCKTRLRCVPGIG
jgi:leucyl-tRNA synthetase